MQFHNAVIRIDHESAHIARFNLVGGEFVV